jgi:hypothetical protein
MALPLHEHPFMTAGVVLQGVIEVRTDSGKTHIARAGEAVIELIDQPHGGANIGDTDAVIWWSMRESKTRCLRSLLDVVTPDIVINGSLET